MNIYFYGLNDNHVNEIKKFFSIHAGSAIENISYEKINYSAEIVARKDTQVYFCIPEVIIGGTSGIDFAKDVRSKNKEAVIIFLSQNNLSVVSILKKYICPAGYFLLDEISDAVKFVTSIVEKENAASQSLEQNLEIISQYEKVIIPISNVVYFMTANKKLMCKLVDGKSMEFYGTLTQIEKKYGNAFIRSHAGYLVNKEKILVINYTKNYIDVVNNESIPVSRKYRQDIKNYIDTEYVEKA